MRNCKRCKAPIPDAADPRQIYCTESCCKRAWDAANAAECATCGQPTSDPRASMCVRCARTAMTVSRREAARPRRERVQKLWAAGASMRTIADDLGITVSTLSRLMQEMRRSGWELPYRRHTRLTRDRGQVAA